MTAVLAIVISATLPAGVAWYIVHSKGFSHGQLAARLGLLTLVIPITLSARWALIAIDSSLGLGMGIFFGLTGLSFGLLMAVLYDADRLNRGTTWTRGEFTLTNVLAFFLQFVPLFIIILVGLIALRIDATNLSSIQSWVAISVLGISLSFISYPRILRLVLRARPIPDFELKSRLIHLAVQAGVRDIELCVFPGKKGKIITGWATGLWGRNRHVFLSDALITTLNQEELEAVFAHELGHLKLGHLWANWMMSMISLGVSVASVTALVWLFPGPRVPPFLIGMIGGTIGGLSALPNLALSRRNELAADGFAVNLTGRPRALVDALYKLELPMTQQQNASLYPPLERVLSLWKTHPSLESRVSHIMNTQSPARHYSS